MMGKQCGRIGQMEALTICVVLAAFIVGNIVTFRMFLGRPNVGQPKAGAVYSNVVGFAVTIGIVAFYILAMHLIWRTFG